MISGQLGTAQLGLAQLGGYNQLLTPGSTPPAPPTAITINAQSIGFIILPDALKLLGYVTSPKGC
jgi:hypothetical protein